MILPLVNSSWMACREITETPRLALIASLTAALDPSVAQILSWLRVWCCWASRDSVLFLVPEPRSRTIKGSFSSSFRVIWEATGLLLAAARISSSSANGWYWSLALVILAPTTPSSNSLAATASTIFAESLIRISKEIPGNSFLKDAARTGRM